MTTDSRGRELKRRSARRSVLATDGLDSTRGGDHPTGANSDAAKTVLNRDVAEPSGQPFLVDVMSRRQKSEFRLLLLVWGTAVVLFWRWWLDPSHVDGVLRFALNSLVLCWPFVLAGYFFYFVHRMKRPNPDLAIPSGLRVAMITTKTPSEPFAIVRHTLSAMLAQQYPHDTWLADEDPALETMAWCAKHGVRVSTRRGVEGYHRSTWPRRTRCKEGNLAFFYDTCGYDTYDIVVQLDADHAPAAGYLEEMLRPFADRAVGYVSAPSICSANAGDSWTARARLNAEGSLHGVLQAGYSAGWAPLCIGSHYAVRTAALREIGGLGPELAEDHSTTLLMNAQGWRGVHAFEATARGCGPASVTDCMTQEYQWARSLVTILLTLTPRHWMRLPARLKFQFVFSQLWYPLFGLVMLTGHLMPIVALVDRRPWANVDYIAFVLFAALVTVTTLAIVFWIKRQGWLRPRDSGLLRWETALFQYVRWPWVLLGSLTAVIDVVCHTTTQFRVTPKGQDLAQALPVRVLVPYALLVVVSASVALLTADAGTVAGYLYLAIIGSMTYAAAIGVVIFRHIMESTGPHERR
jgi:cellulose synthase (UDP-forming)